MRTGKTYRLFQEIERLVASGMERRHILYLNPEDDRLGTIAPSILASALETFYRLSPDARSAGAALFFEEAMEETGVGGRHRGDAPRDRPHEDESRIGDRPAGLALVRRPRLSVPGRAG